MKGVSVAAVIALVLLSTALSVTSAAPGTAGAQQPIPNQKQWPSMFPKNGATKLFENEKVIVWDDRAVTTGFWHKHVRDQLAIRIEEGPMEVTALNGEVTVIPMASGKELPYVAGYIPAGMGPHSEITADPQKHRRQIWIEFKGTEPKDCKAWSTAC